MADQIVKGRGIKVEIASQLASAKVVSAVSKGNPGVATSNAHGLANGTVGFFTSVEGMVQLDGQACRVANQAANTFELQGLNTTNFSDFSGSADFITGSAWVTLAEATSYQIGGGEAEKLNTTALIDVIKQEENGLLAPQTLQFNTLAKTSLSAAMALVESAAQAGTKLLFRITLQDGSVRIAYGEPSMPGENVGQGAVGTGSLSVTVKGFVLKLA
ncbi:MAG: phage tail tube protein [Paucibacter sp.]|nr:phage tail tube protein [Roseateles sp.]